MNNNEIPNIQSINLDTNPTLRSPLSPYELPFYQTKESLCDIESYKKFLDNCISRFRHSKKYKHYKGYLIELGMDKCQFHGNITSEMAKLEMHHNMLTVFDLALIITEHILATKGKVTTFDVVQALKDEHANNRVQLVMLSLTPHQLYHNNDEFFIHPDMCFGNWIEFLYKYYNGITQEIAFKIIFYLNRALEKGCSDDARLLDLRDKILDWSGLS